MIPYRWFDCQKVISSAHFGGNTWYFSSVIKVIFLSSQWCGDTCSDTNLGLPCCGSEITIKIPMLISEGSCPLDFTEGSKLKIKWWFIVLVFN